MIKPPSFASSGHQRNQSAGQQLIVESADSENDEEQQNYGTAWPSHPMPSFDTQTSHPGAYCPSEASSHVAVHRAEQYATNLERQNRKCCGNPQLRDNAKVVLASVILTLVGAALLVVGIVIMIMPNQTDLHGWVFLFAGFLFFTPGIYHVVYILCTLSGRPGYTFDNLPTFAK